jgi:peroxiredoxin
LIQSLARNRFRRGKMKEAAPWIAIALVALAFLFVVTPAPERLPVEAPDFSLENLSGETVTLSALRGKVVVLDFWASWCRPCTRTLPALEQLVGGLSDRGVVLLAISLDRTETAVRDYVAEQGLPADFVLYGSLANARDVKELYGVGGIPRTFVVDREGVIRYSGSPTGVSEDLLTAW